MLRIILFTSISLFGANVLWAQTGLRYSDELRNELIIDHTLVSDFSSTLAPTPWLEAPKTDLPSAEPHAFFCRLEWSLEKKVNMPIRFRLGDVEYVDRLEGKR